ncbi:MAG: hypothetical protein H0Z33_07305 [Bacillaceae bacterium]|nr:hypothetical protein [Bacillaceae bacterium]
MNKTEGLVVEIHDDYMVVMCDDGMFRNLPLPDKVPVLGERIPVVMPQTTGQQEPERPPGKFLRRNSWISLVSVAAVLFLALGSIFALLPDNQPAAYAMANVDINPSFNLFLDQQGTVTDWEALNRDGNELLRELPIRGNSLEDVMPLILEKAQSEGYLRQNEENALMMTVVMLDAEKAPEPDLRERLKQVATRVQEDIEQSWERQGIEGFLEVEVADTTLKNKAEQAGLSMNKFKLMEEAKKAGVNLTQQEIQGSIIGMLRNQKTLQKRFRKIEKKESADLPVKPEQKEKNRKSQPEDTGSPAEAKQGVGQNNRPDPVKPDRPDSGEKRETKEEEIVTPGSPGPKSNKKGADSSSDVSGKGSNPDVLSGKQNPGNQDNLKTNRDQKEIPKTNTSQTEKDTTDGEEVSDPVEDEQNEAEQAEEDEELEDLEQNEDETDSEQDRDVNSKSDRGERKSTGGKK